MSWSGAKVWQKIFGRHCGHAVHASPYVQPTISQPSQLQQICADASYDKHAGISLPKSTIPSGLKATTVNKAASPRYDKEPADRPSLPPSLPTYILETPSKRQPTHCQVIQAPAPSHSGKQRSCCLKQQDGDVAKSQDRTTICGKAAQERFRESSDINCGMCSSRQQSGIGLPSGQQIDCCHQTKLQSGMGNMRQSKYALRPPSGCAHRKQDTNSSLRLSTNCTAMLHRAGSQATGEAFSLHAWCASVDAASSVLTDRHAITDVYASRKRCLRKTIVQLAAGTHEPNGVPYKSRKRRKLVS